MSTSETEGKQQPLVSPSWATGAGVWEGAGGKRSHGEGQRHLVSSGHNGSFDCPFQGT